MTKEEIRLKAVDNAKKYEVWPPAADYQDGLIKGFEDGAKEMLNNPTGGALLYAVEKTAERTKREVFLKVADWLGKNLYKYAENIMITRLIADLKQAMEE